ncbi:MAG: PHP domain-containing protein [Pseudomonadales bacterium]|nr:PHP domain-containing protein [Pseudomonadales bacterium]
MRADLHSHSIYSDGVLTPTELLCLAKAKGISLFSITDHDTMAAYQEPLEQTGITLINGVELSTSWKNLNVHIVGLNVDPNSESMLEATRQQTLARHKRAHKISEKLYKKGISHTLEGAMALADGKQIGRPHFAQHLVNTGVCRTLKSAYKNYLGPGKLGDVKNLWAPMQDIITWIHQAGGTSVLAHPAKYKLTRTRLKSLVAEFKQLDGNAIEIYSGSQTPDTTKMLVALSEEFQLLSSCGSDFHTPEANWQMLGSVPDLPATCHPVWMHWK